MTIIGAMTQKTPSQSTEYARLAAETASDKLAFDVVILDIRSASDFTDYFVILTAESSRHLKALSEDLESVLEAHGAILRHREGIPSSGWMLLDFNDVIVHLFGKDERDYYHIQEVWSNATEVVRIQ